MAIGDRSCRSPGGAESCQRRFVLAGTIACKSLVIQRKRFSFWYGICGWPGDIGIVKSKLSNTEQAKESLSAYRRKPYEQFSDFEQLNRTLRQMASLISVTDRYVFMTIDDALTKDL